MDRKRRHLLAQLLAIALAAVQVAAQQEREHVRGERPHRRATLLDGVGAVHFPITTDVPRAQAFFDQGLALLHGGQELEAERSFREVSLLDPASPMGFWGMALAAGPERADAVEFARDAARRIERGDARERSLVEVVAGHLGVEGMGHAMGDAVEHGSAAARIRLQRDLAQLVALHPSEIEIRALIAREWAASGPVAADRARQIARWFDATFGADSVHPALRDRILCTPGDAVDQATLDAAWRLPTLAPQNGRMWDAAGQLMLRAGRHADAAILLDAALRAEHAALARTGGMPHDVDGYAASAAGLCRSLIALRRTAEAADLAQRALALPRHPRPRDRSAAAALDALTAMSAEVQARGAGTGTPVPEDDRVDLESIGPARWTPRAAPPLRLPRGGEGEASLADFAGRPVLVVFFLGFGCVHCVEQLQALEPRAPDFAAAGIPIVTIGTDTVADVRDALDGAPLPFPVLCDPERSAFRSWGAWDEFDATALHGTFLVDGDGRVRWQDIGADPFMDVGLLLRECVRLLAP